MKNVLMVTLGVAGGLVIADVLTEGAVHTKAIEVLGDVKDKVSGLGNKATEVVQEG